MIDLDFLSEDVFLGLTSAIILFGLGWYLARRRLISKSTQRWVIEPLAAGIFGFFIINASFPHLSFIQKVLITAAIGSVATGLAITIARL
jgi:hypothetical protein